MPQSPDPLVSLGRLRAELRRLREQRRFTQQQVADEMDWSLSKLIRIEGGRNRISTNDLRVLLNHYGVEPALQEQLLALSKDVRRTAWWDRFADVINRDYAAYIGYETVASVIRNFEITIVPGLLQTPEYAEQAMLNTSGRSPVNPKAIELRMERQKLFERETPPETHFIIDESVIRRVVGGRAVMRAQLLHLRTMAQRPDLTLQIMPFSEGLYPRHRRGYVVFEFPDDASLVLYIEGAEGSMIISEPTERKPQEYLESFWQLEEAAGAVDPIKLIDDALERLT
ncbi:helix-turn-helix domain-containing protein [Streptodolium elevatio]|uniref:Helix-turn-helix transcriptional regulator n=1 Tax=Streptodolium elevatio TaxID=3157996 RepID=A0ABV3DAE2_9ACTN